MKDGEKQILICECFSTEHQIVIFYSEDDIAGKPFPVCYMHVHLVKRGFWKRLVAGIRYIFGYASRYGEWDEFIFHPSDAEKIQQLADYLKGVR